MTYVFPDQSTTLMKTVFIILFVLFIASMFIAFLDTTKEEAIAKEKARQQQPFPVLVVE